MDDRHQRLSALINQWAAVKGRGYKTLFTREEFLRRLQQLSTEEARMLFSCLGHPWVMRPPRENENEAEPLYDGLQGGYLSLLEAALRLMRPDSE